MSNKTTVVPPPFDLLKQMYGRNSNLSTSVAVTARPGSASVEKISALANNISLVRATFPYTDPRLLYRQERGGPQVACNATQLVFDYSLVKSKGRETRGELIEGVSILVMGYDVQTDGQGHPMTQSVPNPLKEDVKAFDLLSGHFDPNALPEHLVALLDDDGKFSQESFDSIPDEIHIPMQITQSAEGVPLEPKTLMIWRPQWGRDVTRFNFSQPRDTDMLNLVPNIGVPRKGATKVADPGAAPETATPRFEAVDWQAIPGLQPELEKPITNYKLQLAAIEMELGDLGYDFEKDIIPEDNADTVEALLQDHQLWTAMAAIVDKIPIASNAPSVQKAADIDTSYEAATGQAATALPEDAFASEPG